MSHPNYLPGDTVRVNRKRYGVVECKLPAGNYVVRYGSKKTDVVSPAALEWVHKRR